MPSDGPNAVNLNPGPVPLAEPTKRAMLGELVSHRSQEFEVIYRDCRDGLRRVFETEQAVVIVNGNGNLGLELAVANVVRPGDRVLCLANGKFGDNLAEMVARHTDDRRVLDVAWGAPFDLDDVEVAIDGATDAVVMTHCETSTGMLNPVRAVSRLAAEADALSVVDGVSSVGGEPLPMDEWDIDVAVTASQKCLSAPPGVSAVSLSASAMDRASRNPRTMPYNLDLGRYRRAAARDQTPSTAPVPVYRALRQSLADLLDVGLDEQMARQARRAESLRRAGTALGLEVFPTPNDDSRVSNTVTVLTVPAGVEAPDLVSRLAERGVLVRTGIGPTAARTIRAATMSNALTDEAVLEAIGALESVVRPLVETVDEGGLRDAETVLSAATGS